MSGSFVLIASYPKSGNTWTRIVLQRLLRGVDKPFSINDLEAKYQGIWRRLAFDRWAPVNAADLLQEEMEQFLPDIYRRLIPKITGIVLVKVHEAAKRNVGGEWLYPPDCMPNVIYLVRHPYDVAVSTAHHLSVSLESAVEIMADDGSKRPPPTGMPESLPQTFGSWSSNVESWIDNDSYRVSWARYEDIVADPVAIFSRFAESAGLQVSREEVAEATKRTEFRALQREEEEQGFKERPPSSPQFFRAGISGTWRDVLDRSLRENLVRDHGRVMERLGYGEDGSAGTVQGTR